MRTLMGFAAALGALACLPPAWGADANAGRTFFRQQCALCHSAQPGDNGGAQGPNLDGVFGRRAAGNRDFSYTRALRDSGLTWNAATLDRFLTSPTTVVPGTAMVIAVPSEADRQNLITYFEELKAGTFKAAPPPRFRLPPGMRVARAPVPKGTPDWKKDFPGRAHRVDVAKLPAPYATAAAFNFPRLIPRPANAKLRLPPGFKIDVFTSDVEAPREMKLAPNGDIFLSETQLGRVVVLRPSADDTKPATVETFAQGLNLPNGLAFYPSGPHPKWLYVAETNRVVRYAYTVGQERATSVPEIVVPQLSPVAGGGHFTRDIAFSPDGRRMFVSVGSQANVPEDLPKKTPEQIRAWEAAHGLGTAWGNETNRGDVLVFEAGSNRPGKVYASGIRNCVTLTIQPATGDLWCTTNERDLLGDDLVPDYSTRVREGAFYGWPWYYMGNYQDPRFKDQRPDLYGKVTVPDVPYQAHSASLSLIFYTASSGPSAFPRRYVGDGFAVFHGSWNRSLRTGHKIVRVRMKNGAPTGEYDDFLVGFIADNGDAWGRPVDLVELPDGSLLLSDDGANLIYRISYSRPGRLAAARALPVAADAPPAHIVVQGERIFPESLTSASDGTVIIGSIAQRAIYRAPPGSALAVQWIKPGTDGMQSIFGVLADEASDTLWACSNSFGPPQPGSPPPRATLYAFDLQSGAPKGRYPFPAAGSFCNDISIGPDGTAYATDTNNMEVVRLKKGATQLDEWVGNGAFGPRGGIVDGIVVLDGRVIVGTLATSKLFSVPIEPDGSAGPVTEVTLDQPLARPDGIRRFGRDGLLLAEGGSSGRLSRVILSGNRGTVTVVEQGFPDGPVAVTVVGTTAYLLEGQLASLMRRRAPDADASAAPKPFRATAVEVGSP